jgi:hypothetical protein
MGRSDDFERMFREARRRGEEEFRTKPRALSAVYNPEDRRIHLELTTGALFAFPVDLCQGVAGASEKDIANVEIEDFGHALRWPTLDADLSLEPLMAGVYGSRKWMEELERKGFGALMRREPAVRRKRTAKGGTAKDGRARKPVAKRRASKTGKRRSSG